MQELVALEETIGNVSTGLSEDMILTCLSGKRYSCGDQNHVEDSCAICLVRTLRNFLFFKSLQKTFCSNIQKEYSCLLDEMLSLYLKHAIASLGSCGSLICVLVLSLILGSHMHS